MNNNKKSFLQSQFEQKYVKTPPLLHNKIFTSKSIFLNFERDKTTENNNFHGYIHNSINIHYFFNTK